MRLASASVWIVAFTATAFVPGRPAEAQSAAHECSFCHDVHGASYSQLRTGSAVVTDMCLSCHNGTYAGAPIQTSVHVGAGHIPGDTTACWDCHGHEAAAEGNLAAIPRQRTNAAGGVTRTVVFTALSGVNSFADGDAVYDGVCEVCHTTTAQHRFDGSAGQHYAGWDCRRCHSHDGGFQGTGGCTFCHFTVRKKRRAVVPEFDRSSHHVRWSEAGYLAPDSIPASDCKVCHDQSRHTNGSVRLWNVDAPGDTSASIVLTGNPSTSSTEAAKLSVFCLACHDGDGAFGDTSPFSDNMTVPALSPSLWATASHALAPAIAGCYGNGAFGCHGNGHGSLKTKLLAPDNVGPGTDDAGQEEGFCNACHNGASATNVVSSFAGATRHPIVDSEQAVGRVVECASCHDPHAASGPSHTYATGATSSRNNVSPPLRGVPGVSVDYSTLTNFQAVPLAAYTPASDATYEYQICYGCHAGYAWLPGSPPAGLSRSGAVLTDQAQEFSPQNRSGHPIVTGLANYPNSIPVGGAKGMSASAMKAPWNTDVGQQTMMCSDCHNTDAASPAAQGPHGSAVQFMLRGPSTAWPDIPIGNNGDISGSFCGNCHANTTGNDGAHPHNEGGHWEDAYPCYTCHVVVPHGSRMSRLMGDHDVADGMPARYAWDGVFTTQHIQAFTKSTPSGYTTDNCRAQCYGDHQNTNPAENWNN